MRSLILNTRHFRDGRVWEGREGALYLLGVIMRPCGTNRCQTGWRVRTVRRWRGTAVRWEVRIISGEWKSKSKGTWKWVRGGTNTDGLQRGKCACSNLQMGKNKHWAKWEKIRRWRSRSSDGCPGDIWLHQIYLHLPLFHYFYFFNLFFFFGHFQIVTICVHEPQSRNNKLEYATIYCEAGRLIFMSENNFIPALDKEHAVPFI